DFEVHSVETVTGISERSEASRAFAPFYKADHLSTGRDGRAYFSVARTPRLESSKQRQQGARSSYIGSEVFVSLLDVRDSPIADDLRQLDVRTLCTNRDLPLYMAVGKEQSDFTLDTGDPVKAVRVIA